jgi:hypothetical protein
MPETPHLTVQEGEPQWIGEQKCDSSKTTSPKNLNLTFLTLSVAPSRASMSVNSVAMSVLGLGAVAQRQTSTNSH